MDTIPLNKQYSICYCHSMPKKITPSTRPAHDFSQELNAQQLAVVTHGQGPALVLAGAGSGKTRTIIYRLAYLIDQGIDPHQVLLLTFTNKAAKEMLHRAELLTNQPLTKLWGGTFHHLSNLLLRQFAPLLGYNSRFTILDEEDSQTLIKHVLKEFGGERTSKFLPSPNVTKNLISLAKNTLKPLDELVSDRYPRLQPFIKDLLQIAEIYQQTKQQANSMDFDDLLVLLVKLFNERPDVKQNIQQRFPWVLVDEYQDTNQIQGQLIYHLTGPKGNLVAVGDDAQSIYAFRGADISNILNFPKIYPHAKIYKLETNYRSTPQILNVANAAIANNLKQFPKNLQPLKESGSKPLLMAATTPKEEAKFVTDEIVKLNRQGTPLARIAVLFRATFHSQMLEFALTSRGIPYDYRGGLKFFERAHIKDLLAYLRIIDNVADRAAWLRLLNMQTGVGPVTAAALANQLMNHKNIKEALKAKLDMSPRAKEGWLNLQGLFQRILQAVSQTPAGLIKEIIHSAYRDWLEQQYQDWQDRLADLEQLNLFAENYQDLSSFLAEASLQEQFAASRLMGKTDYHEDKLILSTIHQAKGLEWHAVFLINLMQGGLPHRQSLFDPTELEEERRLFYVGITRAQHLLYLTYPIINEGSFNSLSQRSQFLDELPWGVVEDCTSNFLDDALTDSTIEIDEQGERRRLILTRRGKFLPEVEDL